MGKWEEDGVRDALLACQIAMMANHFPWYSQLGHIIGTLLQIIAPRKECY